MHAMSFLKCALLYQNDPLNPLFPASLNFPNEMESFFLTKKLFMNLILNLDTKENAHSTEY